MVDDCSVFSCRVECDYEAALIVQSSRMVNFGVERRVIRRAPLNRETLRLKLKQDMLSANNQPSVLDKYGYTLKPFDVSRFHFYHEIGSGARPSSLVIPRSTRTSRPTVSLEERLNRFRGRRISVETTHHSDKDGNNGTDDEFPEFVPDSIGVDIPDLYDNMEPKYGGLIDTRMGITDSHIDDATYGLNSIYCPGHSGHIESHGPNHATITVEDLPPLEDEIPDLVDFPQHVNNGPIKSNDHQPDEPLGILKAAFESDESDNELFTDADDLTDDYEPDITYKGHSAHYRNYGIKSEFSRPVEILIDRKS